MYAVCMRRRRRGEGKTDPDDFATCGAYNEPGRKKEGGYVRTKEMKKRGKEESYFGLRT